jgi:hypothetical protein
MIVNGNFPKVKLIDLARWNYRFVTVALASETFTPADAGQRKTRVEVEVIINTEKRRQRVE